MMQVAVAFLVFFFTAYSFPFMDKVGL